MRPFDDDLSAWQDDPVVRALTAPAAADELAGEERVLAAFRATPRARSRRRFAGRFGLGATTTILALGLSGGVAAAYTSSLPAPLQRVAHGLLGPVGVPAPDHPGSVAARSGARQHHRGASGVVTSTPSRSALPSPQMSGSVPALVPAVHRSPGSSPGALPAVSTQPSASPSPGAATPAPTPAAASTPSASPTPTDDPSTWTLTASTGRQQVHAGRGVTVSGRLVTAAGSPVADHRVVVFEHVAGTNGWQRVAVRRTATDGTLRAGVGSLTRTTVLILRAGDGVQSDRLRVVVIPNLSTTRSPSADGTGYDVTLTADGGDPGDTVVLLRRRNGQWERAGSGQLDGNGQATFFVGKPAHQKVHYLIRVPATDAHGAASTAFVAAP